MEWMHAGCIAAQDQLLSGFINQDNCAVGRSVMDGLRAASLVRCKYICWTCRWRLMIEDNDHDAIRVGSLVRARHLQAGAVVFEDAGNGRHVRF
jgi:hypothetical protein